MNNKVYLVIYTALFYFAINEITNTLNIFYPYTKYILTILFALTLFTIEYRKASMTCYLLFIVVFLFYRHQVEVNISFDFYLWEWLKLIRRNKIVFINIFGNLLLFAPLVFYLRGSVLYIIIFIVSLELGQYFTKRGVFDIVDIFLNIVGVLFGLVLRRLYGKQ
ncbi:MAG: VanZ family protein [Acholeplasmataceae bacterium]|nr:VanZ family protein [Acholeplasmataceae bacterium]